MKSSIVNVLELAYDLKRFTNQGVEDEKISVFDGSLLCFDDAGRGHTDLL